jgi:TPR repeat protein
MRWYRKAAQQGGARAQKNLDLLHLTGEVVSQNHIQAHMRLNLAAANALDKDGRDLAVRHRVVAPLLRKTP